MPRKLRETEVMAQVLAIVSRTGETVALPGDLSVFMEQGFYVTQLTLVRYKMLFLVPNSFVQ